MHAECDIVFTNSVRLSIRPSVRLSNTDIVSELKDISSQFFSRYSRDVIRFCAPPPLQNSNANLRVDNCCACLVFCQLISVSFCVTFSFILYVVLFVIKFIKYNDWSFPSLGRKWTPHLVERETRHISGCCRICLIYIVKGFRSYSKSLILRFRHLSSTDLFR